ncbi:unnamed protein product [Nesidiocoris tenuis]|uniref:Uncharacterized protein n=1 Tax=Nesidiocoris tenuis TaxID=355587 RepID=A0A6H5HR55_9HEMI|nr:unnamed protein product [Nesidiocoris tenuis]
MSGPEEGPRLFKTTASNIISRMWWRHASHNSSRDTLTDILCRRTIIAASLPQANSTNRSNVRPSFVGSSSKSLSWMAPAPYPEANRSCVSIFTSVPNKQSAARLFRQIAQSFAVSFNWRVAE